jgi:hypothetical protein
MALACDVNNRQTLHDWAAKYPEFAAAFLRARLESLAWWEREGRGGLWSPKDRRFDGRHWSRMVAGLFPDDWTETQKVELRGALASLDLTKLPDDQLARVLAGEHPLQVLAETVQGRLGPGEAAPEAP